MPFQFRSSRSFWALAFALLIPLGMTACNRGGEERAQARVKTDFQSFRVAVLKGHAEQIATYLPQDVSDYLAMLNSGNDSSLPPGATENTFSAPGVNLLLRAVLDRKMDPAVRAHLNLQLLLQRLADRGLLDCREIRDLSLGRVTIARDRASAELYYRGNLLPLRLPMVRQAHIWKVDLLAMIPYAEVLMRLDRAITGKTESQQVAQIVQPLPAL